MLLVDLFYYGLVFLTILSIFAIFWLIGGFLIYRVVDRKLRGCPNCSKKAAGEINKTDIELISNTVDNTGKKPERVKTEQVTDHYECPFCGHQWMRTFQRTQRTPLDYKVK